MNPRCEWAKETIEINYHDKEWGVPLHNDKKLFEFLVLEGMQAGLVGVLFSVSVKIFERHLIISEFRK